MNNFNLRKEGMLNEYSPGKIKKLVDKELQPFITKVNENGEAKEKLNRLYPIYYALIPKQDEIHTFCKKKQLERNTSVCVCRLHPDYETHTKAFGDVNRQISEIEMEKSKIIRDEYNRLTDIYHGRNMAIRKYNRGNP